MEHKTWKAARYDERTIEKIRKMTKRNDHNNAYIEGCKMIGARQLGKKFELVEGLNRLEGHLPHQLSEYRYSLYQDMMKAAERSLSPDEYKEFYRSF